MSARPTLPSHVMGRIKRRPIQSPLSPRKVISQKDAPTRLTGKLLVRRREQRPKTRRIAYTAREPRTRIEKGLFRRRKYPQKKGVRRGTKGWGGRESSEEAAVKRQGTSRYGRLGDTFVEGGRIHSVARVGYRNKEGVKPLTTVLAGQHRRGTVHSIRAFRGGGSEKEKLLTSKSAASFQRQHRKKKKE